VRKLRADWRGTLVTTIQAFQNMGDLAPLPLYALQCCSTGLEPLRAPERTFRPWSPSGPRTYAGAVLRVSRPRRTTNPLAAAKPRHGPQNRLRVFYCSDPDVPHRVLVEAIGVKDRNRLLIRGQEVKYES
jgi:hypothetical protein